MKERVLSGIQPTGQLHIGNYFGAIRNWVQMQEEYDSLYMIVDLHALTVARDPAELKNAIYSTTAALLACGLDPQKCHIFNQSQIIGHPELAWIFNCVTPMGWLNRMTQFKEKAGKHRENAVLGLYAYPVLQAADILIYKADHVPVGEDQKQHIELCRDIASTFNNRFGVEYFKMPEPQILGDATRVMSLRDGSKKMSKSDESDYSRIHLSDEDDLIRLKIRKAKTDPEPLPATQEELSTRPEALNLVTLYSACQNLSINEVCARYAGANFSEFKADLADVLIGTFSPITHEYNKIIQDRGYLDTIIRQGRDYAQEIASQTIKEVYGIVGFVQS